MSRAKLDKKRDQIAEIEKRRKQLIRLLLSDCKLVEGSLRSLLVRCGRPGCHCEKQPCHPIMRLSRWENGKLKNKVVRIDDRQWVTQAADHYRKHKKALSDLIKLNESEKSIIKTAIKEKAEKYE